MHSVSVACFHQNTSSHLLTSLIYHLRPFLCIPAGRPQIRQRCLPSSNYFLGKLPASTWQVDSVSVCMKLATLPSFDFLAVPCGQVECLCRVLFMSSRTQAYCSTCFLFTQFVCLHSIVWCMFVCMPACFVSLFVSQPISQRQAKPLSRGTEKRSITELLFFLFTLPPSHSKTHFHLIGNLQTLPFSMSSVNVYPLICQWIASIEGHRKAREMAIRANSLVISVHRQLLLIRWAHWSPSHIILFLYDMQLTCQQNNFCYAHVCFYCCPSSILTVLLPKVVD